MASKRRPQKERRRLLPGAVESGLRQLLFRGYGLGFVAVACAAWASLGLAALLVIAMYRVYLPGVVRAGRVEPAFAPPDPGLRRTDAQLGTPSHG